VSRMLDEAAELAGRGSGRVPLCLAPIPADLAARRQYSFSRLTGRLHPRPVAAATASEDDPVEPAATSLPSLRLDPLGLGTLVHDVLAEIDWTRPGEAAALVRRLAPRHLTQMDEADPDGPHLDEPIEMVRRFMASPRAAEMATAGQCYRELEFLLAWPPGTDEPEPRYLQGFIDCLYEDAAGRWVVLDYKTSQATASTVDAVAAEYEMQMLLYALAVERILGQAPADLVLCFLRPALEHHVVWDEKARGRVVELVNQALAACVEEER
jgi:ATP-dependent exoDNAse (exonuclease V) beta subunit